MIRIRQSKRRQLIYIGMFITLVVLNILIRHDSIFFGNALISHDKFATKLIIDAVGPRNSTSSVLVLPSEYTVIIEPNESDCQVSYL